MQPSFPTVYNIIRYCAWQHKIDGVCTVSGGCCRQGRETTASASLFQLLADFSSNERDEIDISWYRSSATNPFIPSMMTWIRGGRGRYAFDNVIVELTTAHTDMGFRQAQTSTDYGGRGGTVQCRRNIDLCAECALRRQWNICVLGRLVTRHGTAHIHTSI